MFEKYDINCFILNVSQPEYETKRFILSFMNTIFYPLGLLTPFTMKAKLIMKNLRIH